MSNVLIYSRVSSDDQVKGYSLRDQQDRLEKFCALNDYTIVKHFQDDYSAKTFDRPEFKKLIEFVKHNKNITWVWVITWDRFGRNVTDSLVTIRMLRNLGVTVNASEQPIDFSIPEQKLLLAFYLASPEIENDRRSMKIRSGIRRAQKEGKWVVTPPLGYKFIYDEHGKPLLVTSEKAPLIAEAFESIATGAYSVEQVWRNMNKKGLHCSRNNFWRRLRNPVYCGKIKVKNDGNEPQEIVQGIHEPIISEEVYNRVQNVLSGKRKIRSKEKTKSDFLPLRGFLVCPKCGKNLTGSGSQGNGGKYFYYHCQPGCGERVRVEVAHRCFSEWLNSFTFKPEIAALYLEIVKETFKKEDTDRIRERDRIKKEIARVNETLLKVEKKYINDEIERDTYLRLKESYKTELQSLTDYLLDLKSIESDFTDYMDFGCTVLANLGNYYESADIDAKRILLGSIFPEKLIFENGKYRTTTESDVMRLLSFTSVDFGGMTIKKAAKNRSLYHQVELEGIEPSSRQCMCKLSTCLDLSCLSECAR